MSDYTPRKEEDEAFALPPVPYWLMRYDTEAVEGYGAECAEAARAPLTRDLAECFNLGGSDADGNGDDWRAANAVRSVRQLRADYDEACDEGEKLRARIAELEAENQTLTLECGGAEEESGMLEEELQKSYDEIDRLRAEVEALTAANAALRADAGRYQYLRDQCRNTDPDRMYFSVSRNNGHDWECVDNLDDAVDAARKGEGE